jgi:hypothetical protein
VFLLFGAIVPDWDERTNIMFLIGPPCETAMRAFSQSAPVSIRLLIFSLSDASLGNCGSKLRYSEIFLLRFLSQCFS